MKLVNISNFSPKTLGNQIKFIQPLSKSLKKFFAKIKVIYCATSLIHSSPKLGVVMVFGEKVEKLTENPEQKWQKSIPR